MALQQNESQEYADFEPFSEQLLWLMRCTRCRQDFPASTTSDLEGQVPHDTFPQAVGSEVKSSRAGDQEEVFQRFLDPVYRVIYRQVGNQQDAEDLTSEVFLSATGKLDATRPDNEIGRWLFTVTRRVIADHWRRHYKLPPRVDIDQIQLAEIVPIDAGRVSRETKSSFLQQLLEGLTERQRSVLELRFLHGYSLEETAAELSITIQNVKIIQHRALAKAAGMADPGS